jgi:integrase
MPKRWTPAEDAMLARMTPAEVSAATGRNLKIIGVRRVKLKRRGAKRPTRTSDYTPPKFASAHDLRRACAERLLESGLSPVVIQTIMRHASWETTRRHYAPGDVQQVAATIRKHLPNASVNVENVPRYNRELELT